MRRRDQTGSGPPRAASAPTALPKRRVYGPGLGIRILIVFCLLAPFGLTYLAWRERGTLGPECLLFLGVWACAYILHRFWGMRFELTEEGVLVRHRGKVRFTPYETIGSVRFIEDRFARSTGEQAIWDIWLVSSSDGEILFRIPFETAKSARLAEAIAALAGVECHDSRR